MTAGCNGSSTPGAQDDVTPGAPERFPAMVSVLPSSGPVTGGTMVLLTGHDLRDDVAITIGGNAVASLIVVDAQTATFVTPSGELGPRDVVITRGDYSVTFTGGFTYWGESSVAPPVLTRLVPNRGPTTGGTRFLIEGEGLGLGALFFLDGRPCGTSVVVDSGVASATSPSGNEGLADLTISNPDGQSVTLVDGFSYFVDDESAARVLVATVRPLAGPAQGGGNAAITGQGFEAGALVFFGGYPAPSVAIQNDAAIDAGIPAHAPGAVDVHVTNLDGRTGLLAAAYLYYPPAPHVRFVEPYYGSVDGGDEVVVHGAAFTEETMVFFDGLPASNVIVDDSEQLRCITPAHAAGSVEVLVANPDGQLERARDAFLYLLPGMQPPSDQGFVVTMVTPNSGPANGGTQVTIMGNDFAAGATVTIGGEAATDVEVVSSLTLRARTPFGTIGAADVVVRNPNGATASLTAGFSYFDFTVVAPAPLIEDLRPRTGPAAGGTAAILTGRNFGPNTRVYFDAAPAQDVTVVDDRLLTLRTPPGNEGAVRVIVVNPDGRRDVLYGAFVYYESTTNAPPVIASVEPAEGSMAGDQQTELLGSGFADGAIVFFGARPASDVATVNAGRLTAVTPESDPGSVDVLVTNPDGQTAELAGAYRFVDGGIVLGAIIPSMGPATGGTTFSLTGTGFRSNMSVSIGGHACSELTIVDSRTVTGRTPPGAVGAADVVVTTAANESYSLLGAFTYTAAGTGGPAPTITEITPAQGSAEGGTSVIVRGTGFLASAVVFFGATAATDVHVTDASTAVVETPAAVAGEVDVTFVNPDGKSATRARGFRYLDEAELGLGPRVTGVTPNRGAEQFATPVVVTGARFGVGSSVLFGNRPALSTLIVSTSVIHATAPAASAGTVDLRVVDARGQAGTLAGGFTYMAAPSVDEVLPNAGSVDGGQEVMIVGEGFRAGAVVTFGTLAATGVVVESGQVIRCMTPATVAPGMVSITVTNSDNQTATLAPAYEYRVPPRVAAVEPTIVAANRPVVFVVRGEGFVNGAKLYLGSEEVTLDFTSSETLKVVFASGHAAGTFDVTVENPDGQGHTLTNAITFSAAIAGEAPDITAVYPSSGAIGGGTKVVITGQRFRDGAVVFFGTSRVTSEVATDGARLECTAPSSPTGGTLTVDVTVMNPDGLFDFAANAFTFSDAGPQALALVELAPALGSTLGGTLVRLDGSGFRPGAKVYFGPVGAASASPDVEFISPETLYAEAPLAQGPGIVAVTVVNDDGGASTLAAAFTYVAPPMISSISPTSGAMTESTLVHIYGFNFDASCTVHFGMQPAADVTFVDTSHITATAPPAMSSGPVVVKVTNPGDQMATHSAFFYTQPTPAPTVTNVFPSKGSSIGGTILRIFGAHFQVGATVYLCAASDEPCESVEHEATSLTFVSETEVKATTKARAIPAGVDSVTVNVRVKNPDSQWSEKANAFTYERPAQSADLEILAVLPGRGATWGGTQVTITGRGFSNGMTVAFCGVVACTPTCEATCAASCNGFCTAQCGQDLCTLASDVRLFGPTGIGVTSPVRPSGTTRVVLTATNGETATMANAFVYGYNLQYVARNQRLPFGRWPSKNTVSFDADGFGGREIFQFGRSTGEPAHFLLNTQSAGGEWGFFVDVSANTEGIIERFDYDIVSPMAVDIDGDGDEDILFVYSYPGQIFYYRNDSNLKFTRKLVGSVTNVRELIAADLDLDGDKDVIAVRNGQEQLFINAGNDVWTAATTKFLDTINDDSYGGDVADIDGDGDLDIAIANGGGQQQRLWLNNAANIATPADFSLDDVSPTVFPSNGGDSMDLVFIDLDGELTATGKPTPDLLITNNTSSPRYYAFINDLETTGMYQDQTSLDWLSAAPPPFTKIVVSDLDGDGDQDLVIRRGDWTSGSAFWPVMVYRNTLAQGAPGFAEVTSQALPQYLRDGNQFLLVDDFTNDGLPDIYVKNDPGMSAQDRMYVNNGKRTEAGPNCSAPSGSVGAGNFSDLTNAGWPRIMENERNAVAADFDNDGDLDLFINSTGCTAADRPQCRPLRYLVNDGIGNFYECTDALVVGFPMAQDDYNGGGLAAIDTDLPRDNRPDVLMVGFSQWNSHPNRPMRQLVFSSADGKFYDRTTPNVSPHNRYWWEHILPVDVDLDGDLDIVSGGFYMPCSDCYDGRLESWLNMGDGFNNGGSYFIPEINAFGRFDATNAAAGKWSDAGDVDCDGDVDLVATWEAPGQPDRLLLRDDATGVYVDASSHMANTRYTRRVFLVDVDHDHDLDVVALDTDYQHLLMNNGSLMPTLNFSDIAGSHMPAHGDLRLVAADIGDLNGDGEYDLVLGTDAGNRTRVWLGSATGHFTDATSEVMPVDDDANATILAVDIDNDCDLDILAFNRYYDRVFINTMFSPPGPGVCPAPPEPFSCE